MQLAIVIFAVEDLQRALRFYETVFSCRRAVDTPQYVELQLAGTTTIGLYAREAYARNIGRAPAVRPAGDFTATELYVRVADVHAAVRTLEATGAPCLSPLCARSWGDTAAYFADPDGNVIAVAAAPAR